MSVMKRKFSIGATKTRNQIKPRLYFSKTYNELEGRQSSTDLGRAEGNGTKTRKEEGYIIGRWDLREPHEEKTGQPECSERGSVG